MLAHLLGHIQCSASPEQIMFDQSLLQMEWTGKRSWHGASLLTAEVSSCLPACWRKFQGHSRWRKTRTAFGACQPGVWYKTGIGTIALRMIDFCMDRACQSPEKRDFLLMRGPENYIRLTVSASAQCITVMEHSSNILTGRALKSKGRRIRKKMRRSVAGI